MGVQEGLAEPVQLCHLLVAGQVEDILDPKIRASQYSSLDLKRLLTILPKYRRALCNPFSAFSPKAVWFFC